jgi:hypothetical protein
MANAEGSLWEPQQTYRNLQPCNPVISVSGIFTQLDDELLFFFGDTFIWQDRCAKNETDAGTQNLCGMHEFPLSKLAESGNVSNLNLGGA